MPGAVNPFAANQALNPRLHERVLAHPRHEQVLEVAQLAEAGEYGLILGPRASGRTTLLRCVKDLLEEQSSMVPVLIRPLELSLTGEAQFFDSLIRFSLRHLDEQRGTTLRADWDAMSLQEVRGADVFNVFLDWITKGSSLRLIFLLDSIELIPPNALVRLANIAHAIYSSREDKPQAHLRNVVFMFAGAISLRYLSFSENPQVSPFNMCKTIRLRDLSLAEASSFLEAVNERFELPFQSEAISRLTELCGGDLNMLQRVAGAALEAAPEGSTITSRQIDAVVDELLTESGDTRDEALRHTMLLVEEDADLLELVMKLLAEGSSRYEPSGKDAALFDAFGISYPELSGALELERNSFGPTAWRFRNPITELLMKRHFTPRRVVYAYSALGHFDRAVKHCDPLLDEIQREFAGDSLQFNDEGLKDLLIAFTNQIYVEGSHESAYRYIALLLGRAFGCPHAMFFDYVAVERRLRAVKFLSRLFQNDGREYDVDDPANREVTEIRVLKTGLFAIETGPGDELRIVVPLEHLDGNITGVVTILSKAGLEQWTQLNVKVQIIQRALRAINLPLSKVELDNKHRIMDSATLLAAWRQATGEAPPSHGGQPAGGDDPPARRAQVFVAHHFNAELMSNLRQHLGRAAQSFDFRYADQVTPVGFILQEIREQMAHSDLALYEMTSPNVNVCFELGLGLGMNKPGFVFRRDLDGGRSVPPLLEGIRRFDYPDYQALLEHLSQYVEEALRRSLLERANFIHFLRVEKPNVEKRRGFVLVLDHNQYRDERDYRKAVEEALAGNGYEIVYPLGTGGQRALTAKVPLRYKLLELLCLIENADWVICRTETLADDPIACQSFIGLGIAIGVEHPNILLTALARDPTGTALHIPADLRGTTTQRYDNLGQLREIIAAVQA